MGTPERTAGRDIARNAAWLGQALQAQRTKGLESLENGLIISTRGG